MLIKVNVVHEHNIMKYSLLFYSSRINKSKRVLIMPHPINLSHYIGRKYTTNIP